MDRSASQWRSILPELALLVLFAVLFTLNATQFDIDPYSEFFHIEAAKEMIGANRFWIPLLNGHDYLIRAPFWTWVVTVFYKVLGVSLWAARLPAIICTLGGVIMAYLVTLELSRSRTTGFFAASVLGISWGVLHLASLSTPDALALTLFLGFVWTLIRWQRLADRRHQTEPLMLDLHAAAMGAILGLLVLVKGTFSVLLLVTVGVLYLGLNQSLHLLPKLNLRYLLGLTVLIPLPWLVGVSFAIGQPGFLLDYTVLHPFSRMLGQGPWSGLQWNPFFHILRLPTDLLPFLLFLPGLWLECLASRRHGEQDYAWLIWLATWFGLGLVSLSLSAFQEPTQILPFYAPMAILIGYYMSRMADMLSGTPVYQNTLSAYILALMSVAVMMTILIFQVFPSNYVVGFWNLPGLPVVESLNLGKHQFVLQEAFPIWKFWLIPGPFVLLLGGLVLYVLQVTRRIPATVFALNGTFLVFMLFVKLLYLPVMQRPVAQTFAEHLNHNVQARDEIVLYSLHPDVKRVLFYLEPEHLGQTRFMRKPTSLQERLNTAQGTIYGVIRANSFFEDLNYSERSRLYINQFNWKWDMLRLSELQKLLLIRLPVFEKMRSELLYFKSLPLIPEEAPPEKIEPRKKRRYL